MFASLCMSRMAAHVPVSPDIPHSDTVYGSGVHMCDLTAETLHNALVTGFTFQWASILHPIADIERRPLSDATSFCHSLPAACAMNPPAIRCCPYHSHVNVRRPRVTVGTCMIKYNRLGRRTHSTAGQTARLLGCLSLDSTWLVSALTHCKLSCQTGAGCCGTPCSGHHQKCGVGQGDIWIRTG